VCLFRCAQLYGLGNLDVSGSAHYLAEFQGKHLYLCGLVSKLLSHCGDADDEFCRQRLRSTLENTAARTHDDIANVTLNNDLLCLHLVQAVASRTQLVSGMARRSASLVWVRLNWQLFVALIRCSFRKDSTRCPRLHKVSGNDFHVNGL